jgi:hypothetical protein
MDKFREFVHLCKLGLLAALFLQGAFSIIVEP